MPKIKVVCLTDYWYKKLDASAEKHSRYKLLDKQECSCTTTEHTPLGKRVIILSLLSQGTFFQTTRSLPLTYCQYPINNYFNLEPKAAVFTLLTEHRCLAGGKFCGENDMSVYHRQDGWFSFLIS